MAEWINDDGIDDDYLDGEQSFNNYQGGSQAEPANYQESQESDEDYIDQLLREQSIEDKSKIKFENEDGYIEERDWKDLTNEEKYNILSNSGTSGEDYGLDESETQLINAIRQSGLTPLEYIQNVEKMGVDRYVQNSQTPQFSVDQYSDDELFVADFISRMGDVTDEEAQEALEKAKENETLFAKQIGAIRNEYKTIEQEQAQQAQIDQQTQAQEQYNQFTSKVVDEINNLREIQGYELNMSNDDMQMLYDFITGQDAAGINYFTKALSDPATLVKIAWYALYGDQMVDNITQYFKSDIAKVREESYKKGREAQDKNRVVYQQKSRNTGYGIDDFA